jgi:FAD/FMN-containing dehydrogenase
MMRSFTQLSSRKGIFRSFSALNHVPQFQKLLNNQESAVVTSASATDDNLFRYNQDWTKKYFGKCKLVLRPSSTQEVSDILAYCNQHGIGVVPQGGNTSLVGGATSLHADHVIISLERMNKILNHDTIGNVLTTEAGCVLEIIENFLQEKNCTIPYDLAAKGSCQIGGNVATNAGGLRLVRFGNLHGAVLGLEVVLPNGEILTQNMISLKSSNIQTSLRKDNTGYDLKQLFIGSEGTLGIITKVSIHTPTKPSSVNVSLLKLHSPSTIADIADIFQSAKQYLNEILSAFEFWDEQCQQMKSFQSQISNDLPQGKKYILIETMGSNSEHDQEKLLNFLETVQAKQVANAAKEGTTSDLLEEGLLAKDLKEQKQLWKEREMITLSISAHPESITVLKYDLSVPQLHMYDPIVATRIKMDKWWNESKESQKFHANYQIPLSVGFGHFGDGNVHLNVLIRKKPTSSSSPTAPKNKTMSEEDKAFVNAVMEVMEPWIFHKVTEEWSGSISAEHGIGIQKAQYLPLFKSSTEYKLMKSIKQLFDPKGIMNPGKVFPEEL